MLKQFQGTGCQYTVLYFRKWSHDTLLPAIAGVYANWLVLGGTALMSRMWAGHHGAGVFLWQLCVHSLERGGWPFAHLLVPSMKRVLLRRSITVLIILRVLRGRHESCKVS